jgi:hypothetical protein
MRRGQHGGGSDLLVGQDLAPARHYLHLVVVHHVREGKSFRKAVEICLIDFIAPPGGFLAEIFQKPNEVRDVISALVFHERTLGNASGVDGFAAIELYQSEQILTFPFFRWP